MTTHWEPPLTDADVRFLLTPAEANVEADALRENIYLRLRVRLRSFLRRSGLVIEDLRESCVDLSVLRARSEFVAIDIAGRFSKGGELAWVLQITAEVAPQCMEQSDAELVLHSLQNGAGDVAVAIDPNRKVQTGRAGQRGDALTSSGSLGSIFECVRRAIGLYLSTHRKATRHENVAMYLRFTFTKATHKELSSLYNRSIDAVNQRLSKTRRELTDAARHCYTKEGAE